MENKRRQGVLDGDETKQEAEYPVSCIGVDFLLKLVFMVSDGKEMEVPSLA